MSDDGMGIGPTAEGSAHGGASGSLGESHERVRLPAWAWHLERQFGRKVAQCPNCGSHDLWENHARATWNCNGCSYEVSGHIIRWVPADPNARQPWEEHKPEGIWFDRLQAEVRRG